MIMNSSAASAPQPSPKSQPISTQSLVLIGMFAAVLAVISQISIPLPTGVPITIQVFGVALVGTVLGWKLGGLAVIVYILLGAIGLPIFANFHGGIQCLVGMTGGYILAWPVMAVLSGIRIRYSSRSVSFAVSVALAVTGLMIVEIAGGFQWSLLTEEMSFGAIMVYSFVAFVPKDIAITVLAVILGRQIQKPLKKAGFLNQ
jgi:biotin transport system substrate-specific component